MNTLYPIFIKTYKLNVLIVGAGSTGAEKLFFMLKSSPDARVEVVSERFSKEVIQLANKHGISLVQETFDESHLEGRSIVISATNDHALNMRIYELCRDRKILVNVADNPTLCDFYLGGVVTKGNLKLAISTNGKSPTLAKRLRQSFEDDLPNDIDELLEHMDAFRKTLKGDFSDKVKALNDLTKGLLERHVHS